MIADVTTTLAVVAVGIGAYFLPTIVALDRDVVNKWSVVVINVLLGWTLIGWAVALAMAFRTQTMKASRQAASQAPPPQP